MSVNQRLLSTERDDSPMATTLLEPSQKTRLGEETFDQLFREARTYNAFRDLPVGDDVLRQLYELIKWGPTSANLCPARILFLRTPEAKERLRPALAPGNVDKTMAAPVTAILGYGDPNGLYPRNPRLEFEEACQLL